MAASVPMRRKQLPAIIAPFRICLRYRLKRTTAVTAQGDPLRRRPVLACVTAILFAGLGQAVLSQPAPTPPPPLMETIRGEAPIQLRGLHIEAQVRGGLAQTTVRMQFFNPNPRPLEGNLSFPLLDGQSVTAFAL